jgi:acetyl esterase/lipase
MRIANRAVTVLVALSCLAAAPASAAGKLPFRVVKDIAYLPDGASEPKHTLDLYLPEGRKNVPVLVSFYGALLLRGDKKDDAYVGERFASAGFATAVVNYRLTPAVTHPGHVQDAAASVAWVKRHIAEYGGRPDQVFVIGYSAGAYLLSLLTTDERYLAAEHLSLGDIRGAVPVSAYFWVERHGVAPDRDKRIWGTDEKVWIDASPAHHLHARVPPTLLIYADGDEEWRKDQNTEFFKALQSAGNTRVRIVEVQGRTHSTIWKLLNQDGGDEVSGHIIEFVQTTIAGRKTQ